jgi:1L-myo-inositol 1-phosphate cytidylyltransferase / CDP-L-myo-inositol myo-inositolphosphotransferase
MRCVIVASPCRAGERIDGIELGLSLCLGVPLIERILRLIASAEVHQFIILAPRPEPDFVTFVQDVANRADLKISFTQWTNTDTDTDTDTSGPYVYQDCDEPLLVVPANTICSTRIIRRLITAYKETGQSTHAVDFRKAASILGDTQSRKVSVNAGRVTATEKNPESFDGYSTGISVLRSGRIFVPQATNLGMWDGFQPILQNIENQEEVVAVNVTGEPWVLVQDQKTLRYADTVMMNSLRQSYDGWIARIIYRPISLRLSIRLAPLGISPTAINFAAFLSFAGGGVLFTSTNYWYHLLAAFSLQVSAVLDGCDGEVARLTYRDTRRGGYVDQLFDRYGDIVVVSGIAISYMSLHPSWFVYTAAIWSAFTFAVASYVTKEFKWLTGEVVTSKILKNLRRRDLRNFLLGLSAVIGVTFWGMVAIACMNHIVIILMYRQAYRRI